jgi:hypothetical protein
MELIKDIWTSFRAMPTWVQIWVGLILTPVNMAAILFAGQPGGWLVAVLALGGMAPNMVFMAKERGLSKAMALSHVLMWTPMVIYIVWGLLADPAVSGAYFAFLWLLLIVDLISLGFDYIDSLKWFGGDRDIARRP